MLVSVLRHLGMDLSHDKDINEIIKSFEVEVPRRPNIKISWNLDVVLSYLCSDKFEPIESCSILSLTKKTLFLLCLASAKRVSEVQALSRDVGFSSGGMAVSLLHGFRAKNDRKCRGLPRSCFIQNLTDLVGVEEEAKLCPVRAVKAYLRRTKDAVGSSHCHLFASPRTPSRPMSKNGISYFLRLLIKEAHKELDLDMLPVLKVNPHEVRAVSTYVTFSHNL